MYCHSNKSTHKNTAKYWEIVNPFSLLIAVELFVVDLLNVLFHSFQFSVHVSSIGEEKKTELIPIRIYEFKELNTTIPLDTRHIQVDDNVDSCIFPRTQNTKPSEIFSHLNNTIVYFCIVWSLKQKHYCCCRFYFNAHFCILVWKQNPFAMWEATISHYMYTYIPILYEEKVRRMTNQQFFGSVFVLMFEVQSSY